MAVLRMVFCRCSQRRPTRYFPTGSSLKRFSKMFSRKRCRMMHSLKIVSLKMFLDVMFLLKMFLMIRKKRENS